MLYGHLKDFVVEVLTQVVVWKDAREKTATVLD